MRDPDDGLEFLISYNDVLLTRGDFGDGLRDWIAFTIAFACNTHCRDKAAALEVLYHEADNIISRVTGVPMPDDEDD